jgi:bifunctional N-acetylglucosamine-1-phosphate-uridyltransferase/glucosamine-1-phosphate-acetyltransferase GlmU-like protein
MHIIIPMSGEGKRFIEAGYKVPKYLINIEGKPIIQHVVELFPGETKFTFICRDTHINNKDLKLTEVLNSIAPNCNIKVIPPHKLGPVFAVTQIFDLIEEDEECVVSYCDFGTAWDYTQFLEEVRGNKADGAIPSYKGFHPHMLGTTNYAFIKDNNKWMIEIREKQPFTDNRMEEYASNGIYYFAKGSFLKKYFTKLIENNIQVNGEYYVSMVFNLMVEDELKVWIPEIWKMLQWGTPQDVEEYLQWSNYFKEIENFKPADSIFENQTTIIPLAGRGQRFVNEGYKDPKPLINVSGKPMIIQAASYLPKSEKNIFVCLKEHLDRYPLQENIQKYYPNSLIVELDEVTDGQACTVYEGLKDYQSDGPLLVAACDNGMLYDPNKWETLVKDYSIDAGIWTFKNFPGAIQNPQMYGWVKVDENNVAELVSVKQKISDNPKNDHCIVGTFWFRNANLYNDALNIMLKDNIRVNNEFYVDSLMQVLVDQGKKVKVFEISSYIGWGTPNDYKTYNYWEEYFLK